MNLNRAVDFGNGMCSMQKNVLDWLESSAKICPDKAVYEDENGKLTFSQVLSIAQSIGTALAELVGFGEPVAVLSGRNIYTPAAFLGIVYSGAFYAPLDSTVPEYRLNKILSNLKAKYLVTDREHEALAKRLDFDGEILFIDELEKTAADFKKLQAIRKRAKCTDPLYVIFTSGSSGNPKGVITSHESLICYINAYCSVMGIDENDRLGNQSPLDYIAAIRDIYIPLKCCAAMYIIPKQYFAIPVKLFDILNEAKITSIGWSVSALTLPTAMGAFDHSVPQYLKKVCFSGSVMPCKCLRVWQDNLPDTLFVNQYGPTEATASCTYYVVKDKVSDTDVLPIGEPYDNYSVFLLCEDGTAAPKGEIGEICVSGPILALGYYNDPERTKQAFIQNPLNSSYREIIYKTGDLALVREDGLLEFHGRKDRQIKHLGHRVELDEIEDAAKSMAGVHDCAALYNFEKEQLLLCYTGESEPKEISVYLRKKIPGFMVPRKIYKLDELPRLANGKTDMQSLKLNYIKN